MLGNFCCVTDFVCAAIFSAHCDSQRYTARQRAYVVYDAIIYSERPLLRLRHLSSNNELSSAKGHLSKSKAKGNSFTLVKAKVKWIRSHLHLPRFISCSLATRYFAVIGGSIVGKCGSWLLWSLKHNYYICSLTCRPTVWLWTIWYWEGTVTHVTSVQHWWLSEVSDQTDQVHLSRSIAWSGLNLLQWKLANQHQQR